MLTQPLTEADKERLTYLLQCESIGGTPDPEAMAELSSLLCRQGAREFMVIQLNRLMDGRVSLDNKQ